MKETKMPSDLLDYAQKVASVTSYERTRLPHGFEIKSIAGVGDTIHGPHNTPLWPRSLLTAGDRTARAIRATLDDTYEWAFKHWLELATKDIAPLDSPLLLPSERKALLEALDSSGGFLVPPQLAADLVAIVRERSVIRREARVIPTASDSLRVPLAEWTVHWLGETPPAGESGSYPIPQLAIPVRKLMGKVPISNDLLADVPALLGYLTTAGGAALAQAETDAFLVGSGPFQPVGMVWSAQTADIEGTTANTISNSVADAGSLPKIAGLPANLPDAAWSRARWFMRGSTLRSIRLLVEPGFPVSLHPVTGEELLAGRPISLSAAMPADGADGARVALLADLQSFVVADRAAVSLRLLRETLAERDQTLLQLSARVGGALLDPAFAVVGVV
jgi:HK97 family phage major capsid protein